MGKSFEEEFRGKSILYLKSSTPKLMHSRDDSGNCLSAARQPAGSETSAFASQFIHLEPLGTMSKTRMANRHIWLIIGSNYWIHTLSQRRQVQVRLRRYGDTFDLHMLRSYVRLNKFLLQRSLSTTSNLVWPCCIILGIPARCLVTTWAYGWIAADHLPSLNPCRSHV